MVKVNKEKTDKTVSGRISVLSDFQHTKKNVVFYCILFIFFSKCEHRKYKASVMSFPFSEETSCTVSAFDPKTMKK